MFVLFVALRGAVLWGPQPWAYFLVEPRVFSPSDWVRVGISLVLLLAALWVILSKRYVPTDRHWAYGTIGTIVGYWLGGA